MSEKTYVTWEEINELVFKLYKELKDKDIDKVVGISRGGLIPGVMLSHWLGAGFEPLEWQTRDGDQGNNSKQRVGCITPKSRYRA